jgi:hypothetical protein
VPPDHAGGKVLSFPVLCIISHHVLGMYPHRVLPGDLHSEIGGEQTLSKDVCAHLLRHELCPGLSLDPEQDACLGLPKRALVSTL